MVDYKVWTCVTPAAQIEWRGEHDVVLPAHPALCIDLGARLSVQPDVLQSGRTTPSSIQRGCEAQTSQRLTDFLVQKSADNRPNQDHLV